MANAPLRRMAALGFQFSRFAGEALRFQSLEIGTESFVFLFARNECLLGFLAGLLFLRLPLFLRGRPLVSGFVIHHHQRSTAQKVPEPGTKAGPRN